MNQTHVALCEPSKGRGETGVVGSAVGRPALGTAVQKSRSCPAEPRTFKMGRLFRGHLVWPLQFLKKKSQVQRWGVKFLSRRCTSEIASRSPGT